MAFGVWHWGNCRQRCDKVRTIFVIFNSYQRVFQTTTTTTTRGLPSSPGAPIQNVPGSSQTSVRRLRTPDPRGCDFNCRGIFLITPRLQWPSKSKSYTWNPFAWWC